jgi:hypothetical protein
MPGLMIMLILSMLSSPLGTVSPLIAEARTIAQQDGNTIWPGFAKTPFPILLIQKKTSLLFCPAGPAKDFEPLGTEHITGCLVKTRKPEFAPDLQATFAAVDDTPTVVIGMPAQTQGNGTAWVATLLHEHMHQMQMGRAGYSAQVKALGLEGDAQDGAWMLDFPFPYADPKTGKAFADMATELLGALEAKTGAQLRSHILGYHAARRAAFGHITAPEARYAEFQLWQEGVARYSEIALAEAAIEGAKRRKSAHDYSALALNLRARVRQNLRRFDLAKNGRVSFYALGAGEALLLDRTRPDWRDRYFDAGLAMGPLVYNTTP